MAEKLSPTTPGGGEGVEEWEPFIKKKLRGMFVEKFEFNQSGRDSSFV